MKNKNRKKQKLNKMEKVITPPELPSCLVCSSSKGINFSSFPEKSVHNAVRKICRFLMVPPLPQDIQEEMTFCPDCIIRVDEVVEMNLKMEVLGLKMNDKITKIGEIVRDSSSKGRNQGQTWKWKHFQEPITYNFILSKLPNPSVVLDTNLPISGSNDASSTTKKSSEDEVQYLEHLDEEDDDMGGVDLSALKKKDRKLLDEKTTPEEQRDLRISYLLLGEKDITKTGKRKSEPLPRSRKIPKIEIQQNAEDTDSDSDFEDLFEVVKVPKKKKAKKTPTAVTRRSPPRTTGHSPSLSASKTTIKKVETKEKSEEKGPPFEPKESMNDKNYKSNSKLNDTARKIPTFNKIQKNGRFSFPYTSSTENDGERQDEYDKSKGKEINGLNFLKCPMDECEEKFPIRFVPTKPGMKRSRDNSMLNLVSHCSDVHGASSCAKYSLKKHSFKCRTCGFFERLSISVVEKENGDIDAEAENNILRHHLLEHEGFTALLAKEFKEKLPAKKAKKQSDAVSEISTPTQIAKPSKSKTLKRASIRASIPTKAEEETESQNVPSGPDTSSSSRTRGFNNQQLIPKESEEPLIDLPVNTSSPRSSPRKKKGSAIEEQTPETNNEQTELSGSSKVTPVQKSKAGPRSKVIKKTSSMNEQLNSTKNCDALASGNSEKEVLVSQLVEESLDISGLKPEPKSKKMKVLNTNIPNGISDSSQKRKPGPKSKTIKSSIVSTYTSNVPEGNKDTSEGKMPFAIAKVKQLESSVTVCTKRANKDANSKASNSAEEDDYEDLSRNFLNNTTNAVVKFGMATTMMENIKQILRKTHKTQKCSNNGIGVNTPFQLVSSNNEDVNGNDDEKSFYCPKCKVPWVDGYESFLEHHWSHKTLLEQKREIGAPIGIDFPKSLREELIRKGRSFMSFSFSDNLVAEMILHGQFNPQGQQSAEKPASTMYLEETDDEGLIKRLKCRECEFSNIQFVNPGDGKHNRDAERALMIHFLKDHFKREFICQLCGQGFSNDNFLTKHYELAHKNNEITFN